MRPACAQSSEFKILLHNNQTILDDDLELMRALGGSRFDLHLFISILDNYYYAFINHTTLDFQNMNWQFKRFYEHSEKTKEIYNKLDYAMQDIGYQKICNDDAFKIVEDIETELIDFGKVTVFNCLFTDLITLE